jgi:hypothetical protein
VVVVYANREEPAVFSSDDAKSPRYRAIRRFRGRLLEAIEAMDDVEGVVVELGGEGGAEFMVELAAPEGDPEGFGSARLRLDDNPRW